MLSFRSIHTGARTSLAGPGSPTRARASETARVGPGVQQRDPTEPIRSRPGASGHRFENIPIFAGSQTHATTRHPAPIQRLGTEQRKKIHKLFSGAYQTKTFRRRGFNKDDRRRAWMLQARAEAKARGGSFDPRIASAAIARLERQSGLTAKGLHLRHIIPYSDIAGIMRVATSGSTQTIAGSQYAQTAQEHVTKLLHLIGTKKTRKAWQKATEISPKLLTTAKGRRLAQKVYYELAHSEKNLYQGGSSANLAIGNRPDPTDLAAGVHGAHHVEGLMDWWRGAMGHLELNPRLEDHEIYDTRTRSTFKRKLHEHDLSRRMKAVHGHRGELRILT